MQTDIDIKALRKRMGWKQHHLARELGLDRSSVSRMERGQPPKGSTRKLLEEIAKRPTPSQTEAA
jgi:transcriptional regulator with XRE-family HTH domain